MTEGAPWDDFEKRSLELPDGHGEEGTRDGDAGTGDGGASTRDGEARTGSGGDRTQDGPAGTPSREVSTWLGRERARPEDDRTRSVVSRSRDGAAGTRVHLAGSRSEALIDSLLGDKPSDDVKEPAYLLDKSASHVEITREDLDVSSSHDEKTQLAGHAPRTTHHDTTHQGRTAQKCRELLDLLRAWSIVRRLTETNYGESSDLEHEEASRVAADAAQSQASEARHARSQRAAGRDGPQGWRERGRREVVGSALFSL